MLGQGVLGDPVTTTLADEQHGTSGILCMDKDEAKELLL